MKPPPIPSAESWLWRPGLDPAERLARLRSLRAIARLIAGPRGDDLARHLRDAEGDDEALVPVLDALDRLAPLDRRRILSSFAGLSKPEARPAPRTTALYIHTDDPRRPRRPDPRHPVRGRRLAA